MTNRSIVQHISDHLRHDHPRDFIDKALNAPNLQIHDLLTSQLTHSPFFSSNHQLDTLAVELFGPCVFFDSSKARCDNQTSRAEAATAAASRVNEKVSCGEINEGADGELLSLYSSLSDLKADEYFAKGTVANAIGNFQARRAVRGSASVLGLNGATAAKDFRNEAEFEASLKTGKQT